MTELRALTYVEIDIKYCSLTYGAAPCTAAVGVTGEQKCFNTRNQRADCQDPDNFTSTTKTVRFAIDTGYLPPEIDCIPNMLSAEVTNAVVRPGESIGERAKLRCTFKNHRHGDAGFDKYIVDRSYDPFDQGTFWGKFRARNTYLESRPIRIYRGYLGQTLEEMDCEHFVVDTVEGPNASGQVTISGSDFMRLLNSEKAQAPRASNGQINANITELTGTVTLAPPGVGDEYELTGKGSLGKETVTWSRAGDVFTLVRGVDGTTPEAHEEGTTLQVMLEYTSENAAHIVNDLIINYSPLDSSYTDLPAWEAIVTSFADVLYSARIPTPTPVAELLNELVAQAGLVVFGNTRTQKIHFDVLRPNPVTGRPLDEDTIVAGSFAQIDQPKKRFSQVWVFYNQRDIYVKDEPSNYWSAVVYPVAENLFETESIKKIYSRWIPLGARSVATDVAARAIARYQFPPLGFRFATFAQNARQLGEVVPLRHPVLELPDGSADTNLRAIIIGVTASSGGYQFEAEEYNINAEDFGGDKIIQFDYDIFNVNLREVYDTLYSTVDTSTDAPDVVFIVSAGVVVGSVNRYTPAMSTGSWPVGVEPKIVIEAGAYVVGAGGQGGFRTSGRAGGPALLVSSAVRIDNRGVIGGGGGGGGGAVQEGTAYPGQILGSWRGGGGAGRYAGAGFQSGTLTEGGDGSSYAGGTFGDGGDLGEAGVGQPDSGSYGGYPGGAAGDAINGVSLVTFINAGDIRGDQNG